MVENNGDGTLSASFEGARTPEFVNEYEAEFVVIGDNEADLQVTKSVTGAGALSEFEFKLQLTTNNAAAFRVSMLTTPSPRRPLA